MKKVLIIAFMLILSGCSTRVTSYELKKITDTCQPHGGVYAVHSNTDGSVAVRCNDGHFEWVTQ